MKIEEVKKYIENSRRIRNQIIDMVYEAKSGHIGGSMSVADILGVLTEKFDSENDEIVFSKGHASPALYAFLNGIGILEEKKLKGFRKIEGELEGHPSNHTKGVRVSTGSLGQGLSCAIGIALAKKMDEENGKVFVFIGDGEMQEGNIWEAFLSISKYKLDNLVVIIDSNKIQLDGRIEEIKEIGPICEKLKPFNMDVYEIDGHNYDQIHVVLEKEHGRTKVIIANTVKGKGVSFMENSAAWHGKAPNDEQYIQAKKEINII